MKASEIKPGDRVFIRGGAANRMADTEGTVAKVARVWVTVSIAGKYRDTEMKFRLDSQSESPLGYGDGGAVFYTPEQWEQRELANDAMKLLRGQRLMPDFGSPWRTNERLIALANFARQYNEEHPEE